MGLDFRRRDAIGWSDRKGGSFELGREQEGGKNCLEMLEKYNAVHSPGHVVKA